MDPRIETYLDLLFKWNKRFALTAFSGREEALALGVAPSLLAVPHLPRGARVLDVGSGGGIPAVPLAVARPDLDLVLAEPSNPKAVFLCETARALGLTYRVEAKTCESLLAAEPERWDAITVRGVHLRKGFVRKLIRSLGPGGVLLVWAAGARAGQYRFWMEDLGLEVDSSPVPDTPLAFLAGHVPRGTSGQNTLE
jgi:16S rRNA (guanine527-N7)-methyltransferase